MMISATYPRFQSNQPAPKSRFQQALEKVTISDELAQKLEAVAKTHHLDAEAVKNVWRNERATLDMLGSKVTDEQLLKEFETRNWQQKIGPRN